MDSSQGYLFPVISDNESNEYYTLYVPTKNYGVFALSNLNNFCKSQLDPLLGISSRTFILDFSKVKLWDISAVMWLVIALQYYKSKRLQFKLKLPDPADASSEAEANEYTKSADFLRRWRFDVALRHVADLPSLLLPHQQDFFDSGPRKYYTDDALAHTPEGFTEKLISNRLVEIRDMTHFNSRTRTREISDLEIQDCIRQFQDARIGNILLNNCDIAHDVAECFAEHLVTESLLNMCQHPNATTGFISVSVLGKSRELILCVVDNGDSIANTILDVYNSKFKESFDRSTLASQPLSVRSNIVNFATQPYVSSKLLDTNTTIGLGLTYIKQDVINKFRGKLRIITESVQLIYSQQEEGHYDMKEWPHLWRGNLLRISIPLKRDHY